MNIYKSFQDFSSQKPTVVTIGTFDGVHIGHQEIIKRVTENAQKIDGESVILTFFPHPRIVLQKDDSLKLLNTIDEKVELLKNTGLNSLIIQPFTKDFSRLTALDFVKEILVKNLNVKKLVIGYDHHFGRNREGNFEQLQEYGNLYGFELEEIPAQDIKNIAVSSTKIRTALEEGDIERANNYLGYNYTLSGEVVKGNALGRKFDYPTLNLNIKEHYKLVPKQGVYAIKTNIGNQHFFGMMNIGNRPTIDGKQKTVEVHLFDFNTDLYGKEIQVEILKFIRNEQKFDALDTLYEQIKKDEQTTRNWIANGEISF